MYLMIWAFFMIQKAEISDLDKIIKWIPDEQACKFWAGPKVRYPFNIGILSEDIGFDENISYSMINNEQLVAFGQMIMKKNGYLHLARIIVNPEYRGNKLGEKLCKEMIEKSRKKGYHKFSLNVYRNNRSALRLYEKLDFRIIEQKSTTENCYMKVHYTV